MEILYMHNLLEWEQKYAVAEGMNLEEISNFEKKYNVEFPRAYKEFLYMSGVKCEAINWYGHRFRYAIENQNAAAILLKKYNLIGLVRPPFWVIAIEGETFIYFHLDEGDNPPMHVLYSGHYDKRGKNEYAFKQVSDSFEQWIGFCIENYEKENKYR